jgi:hypothetical protein
MGSTQDSGVVFPIFQARTKKAKKSTVKLSVKTGAVK